MHETSKKILSVFQGSGSEMSTSEVLRQLDADYSVLREQVSGAERRGSMELKRVLAKRHRRVLHHLNRLVSFGLLSVVRHGEKGEKFFSLNLKENEELVASAPGYKTRVIAARPPFPLLPIEGYEQKGIVMKYEPATWIDRLSSLVVLCDRLRSLGELQEVLAERIFSVVNDVVSLENFERFVSSANVRSFLEDMDVLCEEFGRRLSISVNLSGVGSLENFESLLGAILEKDLGNIVFVFGVDSSNWDKEIELLVPLIEVFQQKRRELYVKNVRIHPAPYFIGRAGPYSFLNREWQLAEELKSNLSFIGCSQSTVIVDVGRFFSEHGLDVQKFSDLLLGISKSALSANSIQRRKSGDCFRSVLALNKGYEADFLSLARNYIRLWNFGLHQEGLNPEFVLNMVSESKKKIDLFASAEETIYKSCGMTTRFRLALSPAFVSAGKLSARKYSSLVVGGIDDLHKKDVKQRLQERESTSQLFDGGDDVTFHYVGSPGSDVVARQIATLLGSYRLPMFSFAFTKMKGDSKLTQYFQ